MRSWLTATLLLLASSPAWADDAVLVLRIGGVKAAEGQLLVAVYGADHAEAFSRDATQAVAKQAVAATAPLTEVRFEGLPAGRYAVAVVHDVDGDGKLALGKVIPAPTEPIGASRDAKAAFGPPAFDDAAFALPSTGEHVETFTLRKIF